MNLLHESRGILERAGYAIAPGKDRNTFFFENENVVGFLWVIPTAQEIADKWEEKQGEFLRQNDMSLRSAVEKSWNVYSVLLAEEGCEEPLQKELKTIEEDFVGTRKIAQAGITSTAHLIRALYPLIPIHNVVQLQEEDGLQRLQERLSSLPNEALSSLLGSSSAKATVQVLLENVED